MSTNFYAYDKEIDKAVNKIKDKTGIKITIEGYPYHLGKSILTGFILQYPEHNEYDSWKSMKEWLKDKIIKDEYGRNVSYDEFIEIVEKPQVKGRIPIDHDAYVIDGYIFYKGEFC